LRRAASKADLAFAIANDSQCGKTEDAATLDHFGHAINLNQLLLEVTFLLLLFLIVKSHIQKPLEFQSSFTSGVGQSLNPSVVLVSTAIKSDDFDTRFFRTLRYQLAHLRRRVYIAGLTLAQIGVQG
jgi:hypothetical protein